MPSAKAHIFKKLPQFAHKGAIYEVVAYQEPNDPRLFVEALNNSKPVIITYSDGFQARLVYSVDPTILVDFGNATGNSAVDALMDTAAYDIKHLL
jgi:hypothetical protein